MNLRLARLPLLLLAMLTLLAAMWAGLLRMGWRWPPLQPTLPINHGPLMVSGFFGTLISLERAVAVGKRWAYLGPLFSALGGLLLIFGAPGLPGPLLLTLGSAWLVAIFLGFPRRHPADFTLVMTLGAASWLVGSLLWLAGRPVYQVVSWWAAFLVLTIAGERLELGRVLRPTPAIRRLFSLAVAVYLAGLLLSFFHLDLAVRLTGLGMLGLALWLVPNDVARRTLRQSGLTRFIAASLMSGYFWLGLSGLLNLAFGALPAGPRYDAALHAVFVGFVVSMVFGHAPIIFPAVLNLAIVYRPFFYAPLLLLHASLLLRIAGDLGGFLPLRQWGGLLNAIAILLYFAMLLTSRFLSRGASIHTEAA